MHLYHSPANTDLVIKYFGIRTLCTLTRPRDASEESSQPEQRISDDLVFNLSCYITRDIKYMMDGIKSKLDEHVQMSVDSIDGNGGTRRFHRTVRITRLPQYLIIVFMRFFYKESLGKNSKILKEVKFPHKLDVSTLCEPQLLEKIRDNRAKVIRYDEDKVKFLHDAQVPMTDPCFPNDPGSNNNAMYELVGVVTHKGRSSSTGHYVTYLNRSKSGSMPCWYQYDDEMVTPISDKDIDELAGGGDWHSAYMLAYRSRSIPSSVDDW
ncbi:hypothetical protein ACOME3_010285 [Neoechinorhynchus agilis]